MYTAASLTTAQTVNTQYTGWLMVELMCYTHNRILLAIQLDEIWVHATTWRYLETIR